MKNLISVILPCYNEEKNVQNAIHRILKQFEKLDNPVEIIVIDNNSSDETFKIAESIAISDSRIKLVKFTRNFGPNVEASLMAGYKFSKGDAVIVIYSDLQDPPELIPKFVSKWNEGYKVVNGIHEKRLGEPYWRRISVKIFYKMYNFISESPAEVNGGDFKLIDREVVNFLLNLPEKARFNRGLISWAGFKSTDIKYDRQPRIAGKSKVNFFKIFSFSLSGITSFSLKPLRLLTYFGIFILLGSFILMCASIAIKFTGSPLPGLTTIIVLLLSIFGFNMFAIGILGEYLGRMQIELKNRPMYLIEKTMNFDELH